ncbi:MAG: PAS domain S-box protein [Thermovirgaceae bacterium]|nr:PAS domain S-box protein [Thermovirgaceae bacterium]
MRKASEKIPDIVNTLFEEFFDHLSEAVVLTDENMFILRVNRAFSEMFGYASLEVVGKNIDNIVVSGGALREEARQFSASTASGKSVLADTSRRKKDGTLFPVSLHAIPFSSGSSELFNFVIYRHRFAESSVSLGRDELFGATLLEHSPNPILVVNPDTSIRYVNRAFEKLTHFTLEELAGEKTPYPWWAEERYEYNRTLLLDSFERGAEKIEYLFKKNDGTPFWIEMTGVPVRRGGVLQYYLSNWVDITERRHVREELQRSEERLRLVFESSRDGLWDWDIKSGSVVFSPRWAEMLGYDLAEIKPHVSSWKKLLHPDDEKEVKRLLAEHFEEKSEWYESSQRLMAKDGSWKWILDRGKVVSRDAYGSPLRMVGTHTDIREQKALEEELAFMARHDQLTGLFNRHYFNDYIEKEIRRSQRYDHPVAFLMADIDGFKKINDTFGHHVGDIILRDVARLLSETVRDIDSVVRYGGDEFLVVLVETDGEKELVKQRILSEIERRKTGMEILGYPVTLSIGGSHLGPGEGDKLEAALAEADRLMYEAKAAKKPQRKKFS